jgi:hypothetical protein
MVKNRVQTGLSNLNNRIFAIQSKEMKASELRIGNYIMNDGVLNKIHSIGVDIVQLWTLQNNIISAHTDLIKPVLIRGHLLKRFGFEVNSYKATGEFWIEGKMRIAIRGNVGEFQYGIKIVSNIENRWYVEYVSNPHNDQISKTHRANLYSIENMHQLQNIFYCLTGQELMLATPVNA